VGVLELVVIAFLIFLMLMALAGLVAGAAVRIWDRWED